MLDTPIIVVQNFSESHEHDETCEPDRTVEPISLSVPGRWNVADVIFDGYRTEITVYKVAEDG